MYIDMNMDSKQYLDHWQRDGHGPGHKHEYKRVRENIHLHVHEHGHRTWTLGNSDFDLLLKIKAVHVLFG